MEENKEKTIEKSNTSKYNGEERKSVETGMKGDFFFKKILR